MNFAARDMIEVYKKLGPNIIGVEIGVRSGENIKQIIENCPNIAKMYGVDPWIEYTDTLFGNDAGHTIYSGRKGDKNYKKTLEVLADYIAVGKVKIFRLKSTQAVIRFKDKTLDLGFVDGNHSKKFVIEDCVAWWPKIKPGGILSGHDFKDRDIEVREAVFEFSEIIGQPILELSVEDGATDPCWYFRKE